MANASQRPPPLQNLEGPLANEEEVLHAFLDGLTAGSVSEDDWRTLAKLAERDNRTAELAFAYESIAQGKRIKTYAPALAAEFSYRAAVYFSTTLSDDFGARNFLERAVALSPGHERALRMLVTQLEDAGDLRRVADVHLSLAKQGKSEAGVDSLRRAVEILLSREEDADRAITALQELVRWEPADATARKQLAELYERAGRLKDLARLSEQVISAQGAGVTEEDVLTARTQLVHLYGTRLREPEKALPHLEAVLLVDPGQSEALEVAEHLLTVRATAGRAAAALRAAAAVRGDMEGQLRYLHVELEYARGAKRKEVLGQIGAIKEGHLSDLRGAFEAYESAFLLDPTDDALRAHYKYVANGLGAQADAAKTMLRVAPSVKDQDARIRIGVDTGELLVAGGDLRRAKASFASALAASAGDTVTLLRAARGLDTIGQAENDPKGRVAALEHIVTRETDPDLAEAATLTLAELANYVGDESRAVFANKRLLETSHRPAALAALVPLLEHSGAHAELVPILEELSLAEADAGAAERLAVRAAELLGGPLAAPPRAIAAWAQILARFGPSPATLDAYEALLAAHGEASDHANILELKAVHATPEERPAVLLKLARLCLRTLEDDLRAADAYRHALEADLTFGTRDELESMLESPIHRYLAARVLEPYYRAAENPGALLRTLRIRAADAASDEQRIQATEEGIAMLHDDVSGAQVEFLRLRLRIATESGSAQDVDTWLRELELSIARKGDFAEARARTLAASIDLDPPENLRPEAAAVVLAAASAFEEAGAFGDAARMLRHLLPLQSRLALQEDLLSRIDGLLKMHGGVPERIAVYREALGREEDALGKQRLLRAIAKIEQHEGNDARRASATLEEAFELAPQDDETFSLLRDLYVGSRADRSLANLLERRLELGTPAQQRSARREIALVSLKLRKHDEASAHLAHLLEYETLSSEELAATETISSSVDDPPLRQRVLALRIQAAEPGERAMLRVSLGASYLRTGDRDLAKHSLSTALAEALEREADSLAIAAAEALLHIDSNDDTTSDTLAALYRKTGQSARAVPLLEGIRDRASDTECIADREEQLSEVFEHELGQDDAAFEAARRAFSASPARAQALARFERLAQRTKHEVEFAELVEGTARDGGPFDDDTRTRFFLARARAISELRPVKSVEVLKELLSGKESEDDERVREATTLFENLSDTFDEPRQSSEKRWLMQWRIDRKQGAEKFAWLLGWATDEANAHQPAAALAVYNQIIAIDPGHVEALFGTARAALALSDLDRALECYRSLRLSELNLRPLELELAAKVLATRGPTGDVLDIAKNLLSADPTDERAFELLRTLSETPAWKGRVVETFEQTRRALSEANDDTLPGRGAALRSVCRAIIDLDPHMDAPRRKALWEELLAHAVSEEEAFPIAIEAAHADPSDERLWDRIEELASSLRAPDPVAEAYQTALSNETSRDQLAVLGERAIRFYEEWYEEAQRREPILELLFERLPDEDWVFESLKLLLDAEERWSELFSIFDRAIARARGERALLLLEDAAHTAKDFAKDPNRAIHYFEELDRRKPASTKTESALERLYERHGRSSELVTLLVRQRERATDAEKAVQLTLRATDVAMAQGALPRATEVLERFATLQREEVRSRLEAILAAATSDAVFSGEKRVRSAVAQWLRAHYEENAESTSDLTRVLEAELEESLRAGESEQERSKRERLADLYTTSGPLASALPHRTALLLLDPRNEGYRSSLEDVARRLEEPAAYADALERAAALDIEIELAAHYLLLASATYAEHGGDRAAELAVRVARNTDVSASLRHRACVMAEPLLEVTGPTEVLLELLELDASLEGDVARRVQVLGKAARLAEHREEWARAATAWETRLAVASDDHEALEHLAPIYEKTSSAQDLVRILERRLAIPLGDANAQRKDAELAARLLEEPLGERPRALAIWRSVEEKFGPTYESARSLARLYEEAKNADAFCEALGRAAGASTGSNAERAALLTELAVAELTWANRREDALVHLDRALSLDPSEAVARKWLTALLEDADVRARALALLLRSHRELGEHLDVLGLTEHRLAVAQSDDDKFEVFCDAMVLAEAYGDDKPEALVYATRALFLAPWHEDVETELLRLAEATNSLAEASQTLDTIIKTREGLTESEEWPVRMRISLGRVLLDKLDAAGRAFDAFEKAYEDAPRLRAAAEGLVRAAAAKGRFAVMVDVLLRWQSETGELDPGILSLVEADPRAAAGLADAARTVLLEHMPASGRGGARATNDLDDRRAVALCLAAVRWFERAEAPLEAEELLERMIDERPAQAEVLTAELVRLRRPRPSRKLVESLWALSRLRGSSADLLREAVLSAEAMGDQDLALVALDYALSGGNDLERRGELGAPLLRWTRMRAATMLEERADWQRLGDMLAMHAELPYAAAERQDLLLQASRVLSDRAKDVEKAGKLLLPEFQADPRNAAVRDRLTELYEAHAMDRELLDLITRQIESTSSSAERAQLRLRAAHAAGALGDVERNVDILRATLSEERSHEATVTELARVLRTSGRATELEDLFQTQSEFAREDGRTDRTAAYLEQAADVASTLLEDAPLALRRLERAIQFEVTEKRCDRVAELAIQIGQPLVAIRYLQTLLGIVVGKARVPYLTRLADAHLAVGGEQEAIAALEETLALAPETGAARNRLITLCRARGDAARLAPVLFEGVNYATDDAERVALLRESAELYTSKLEEPSRAAELLERATELAPDDRSLAMMYADALGQSGNREGALEILSQLAGTFGTRRPKERAPVHYYLARLHLHAGRNDDAFAELETATRIDPTHLQATLMLATLAKTVGKLDRAERAYRSVLNLLRRSAEAGPQAVYLSDVLLHLSGIAKEQGEAERAIEILETAFEAAAENPFEADNLERLLRAAGETALLVRALRQRAERGDPHGQAAHELSTLLAKEAPEAAWQHALAALDRSPTVLAFHGAARTLASAQKRLPELRAELHRLAERAERGHDSATAAFLLSRAADLELELDPTAAAVTLERARELGLPAGEVLPALAKVYAQLGVADKQADILEAQLGVANDDVQKRDLLRMLAELRAKNPETLDSAADHLAEVAKLGLEEASLRILRDATDRFSDHARLVSQYDELARSHGSLDDRVDALGKLWSLDPSTFAPLEEGFDLAKEENPALAEQLLRRCLELGAAEGTQVRPWALDKLSELRASAGDISGSLALLRDAARSEDPDKARPLYERLGKRAVQAENLVLAVETYETLREMDASDPDIWQPLAALYRTTQQRAKLLDLLEKVTPDIVSPEARAELALERVQILRALGETSEDDLTAALEAVLEDDPTSGEAIEELSALYMKRGGASGMIEFLERQIHSAKLRRDAATVGRFAKQLAESHLNAGNAELAARVLRDAAEVATSDKGLLHLLLRAMPSAEANERMVVLERLLKIEEGPEGARIAIELASLREAEWDAVGAERALELGFRAAPRDPEVRAKLEAVYRERSSWFKLAEFFVAVTDTEETDDAKAESLRRAATTYMELANEPKRAAIVLEKARSYRPTDVALLEEHVAALVASEQPGEAAAQLSVVLDSEDLAETDRAVLLGKRAQLRAMAGDEEGAMADLEGASGEGGPLEAAVDLAELAERLAARAIEQGDAAAWRRMRLKLAHLAEQAGEGERARSVLEELLSRDSMDEGVLFALAAFEERTEAWDAALATYDRLVANLEGEPLGDVALRMADLADRTEQASYARAVLERAAASNKARTDVQERLLQSYEAAGEWSDAARITMHLSTLTEDVPTKVALLQRTGAYLLDGGGSPSEALVPLEEALALVPTDLDIVCLLADAYTMAERAEDAGSLLKHTIAAQKGRRTRELGALHHRMARVAQAQGDQAQELQALSTALDMDPQNGTAAAELAQLALDIGNFEVASRALRAVTLLKQPGPMSRAQAYELLGEIAHQQGDPKRAMVMLKRALDEEPHLERAQALLASLRGK
ncbi:MAG: tetratricopeptide repeat protein [Polyangiaceae bacterium]